MTGDRGDPEETAVGYRRPPISGQFRKGQSGNPRGRPRKHEAKPDWEPARFPTAEVLRAEAARRLTINDASGRQQVTTTEAVVRALALAAMRGGVLAQRTYLERQKAEDARLHQERAANFEFWRAYQENGRRSMDVARDAGRPAPDFLPYPEDIVLDAWRLGVRFLGALDDEGRALERQAEAFQRLSLEMAVSI